MAQENDPRHVVTNSHNISSDVFFVLFFSFFGSVDFFGLLGQLILFRRLGVTSQVLLNTTSYTSLLEILV